MRILQRLALNYNFQVTTLISLALKMGSFRSVKYFWALILISQGLYVQLPRADLTHELKVLSHSGLELAFHRTIYAHIVLLKGLFTWRWGTPGR